MKTLLLVILLCVLSSVLLSQMSDKLNSQSINQTNKTDDPALSLLSNEPSQSLQTQPDIQRDTNIWSGAVSSDWSNGSNWSLGRAPIPSDAVIILPASNQPIVDVDADCGTLTMYLNMSLSVTGGDLTVNGDFLCSGALTINSYALRVYGIMSFNNGSTLQIEEYWTWVYLYNNLIFNAGSNINPNSGLFVFSNVSVSIATYAPASISRIHIDFGAVVNHNAGTESLTIKDNIQTYNNGLYKCTVDVITYVYNNLGGQVMFEQGTLCFVGDSDSGMNTYLGVNNVIINKANSSNIVTLISAVVNGTLTINSGRLRCVSNLWMNGNWVNNVGQDGLLLESSFYFTGTNNQTFYSVETELLNYVVVDKSGGSLIINNGTDVSMQTCNFLGGTIQIDGSLTINTYANEYINGAFVVNGALDLYRGVDANSSITGSITVNNGTCNIHGGSNPSYLYPGASIIMNGGVMDFIDKGLRITDGATYNVSGGSLRIARDLLIYHTAFNQTGGSIELYGSYPSSMILQNTPQMFSLVVNKNTSTIPVVLSGNVRVNGYLDIVCGRFQAGSNTIYSAGFFQRYPEGSFEAQTGTVEFVGDTQIVYSSFDFNNLRINCPGIVIMYNNTNVNCESFEWVSGALQSLTGNVFNAYDVAGAGIYGNYHVTGGDINLNQDSASNINIYGSVNITDGNFRIYGGSGTCNINGSFSMSGGVFDVQDQGVTIGVSCSASISGGRIRTPGSFSNNLSSLVPAGCTLEMYGDGAAELHMYYNTSFNNLIVSKEGFHVIACTPIGFTGYVYIFGGTLYSSYPVSILGDVEIYDQMHIANSNLFLGGNTYLTVHNGGAFIVEGNVSANAVVTRYPSQTGFYSFNINPGGRIAAYRTLFEYMGVNGIYLQYGAIVDESAGFHHCRFRDGAPGGTLLTLDTGQDLAIYDAEFLFSNTGVLFNVTKTVDEGNVSFYCYSGTMSGFTYEFDTLNRIFWYENEIPQVKELNIVKETTTNQIRLDWTYPIFEAAYNIYHCDEPEGTFEHITTVNDNFITISVPPGNVSKFYQVTAVLED